LGRWTSARRLTSPRFRCITTAQYLCQLDGVDATGTSTLNTNYGTDVRGSYRANSGGTHTISVRSAVSGYMGTYPIQVLEAQDEHGDTIGTATTIISGTA
jgi:hypothetical protein